MALALANLSDHERLAVRRYLGMRWRKYGARGTLILGGYYSVLWAAVQMHAERLPWQGIILAWTFVASGWALRSIQQQRPRLVGPDTEPPRAAALPAINTRLVTEAINRNEMQKMERERGWMELVTRANEENKGLSSALRLADSELDSIRFALSAETSRRTQLEQEVEMHQRAALYRDGIQSTRPPLSDYTNAYPGRANMAAEAVPERARWKDMQTAVPDPAQNISPEEWAAFKRSMGM